MQESSHGARVKAQLGKAVVSLEILRTDLEHQTGFMYRDPPEDKAGLLFVYGSPRILGFWMKDVPFDLDLLALDSSGRVAQIERLRAWDTRTVSIGFPCNRAIELPAGFCSRNNVQIGTQLILLAR